MLSTTFESLKQNTSLYFRILVLMSNQSQCSVELSMNFFITSARVEHENTFITLGPGLEAVNFWRAQLN